ncbi:MAG: hypothetical protein KKB74_12810 [Bacteroidetes bacterium]|nr:hypothetical protein [Bacteroidota bacterium]
MPYGRTFVKTKVGGILKIVRDTALLVLPNHPSSLGGALIRVLSDMTLANNLRQNGLKHVKQFDWDVIVNKYGELYERLVEVKRLRWEGNSLK